MIAPLRDRRTIDAVKEQGHRGRSGPVSVRFLPSPHDERCLVAFAVGRRTGTAVVRNRVRRRLRAALAEIGATGPLPMGAVIISAGAPVATDAFVAVRRDLRRALDRAIRPTQVGP